MVPSIRPLFLLTAGTLLLACGPKASHPNAGAPQPPPVEQPAPQGEGQESEQDGNDDACRDWSTLDLSTVEPPPRSPWAETFDRAWKLVIEKHYDPTLGCTDWLAVRETYGAKVAAAKDEAAAFKAMNEMLSELGQSHMAIVPASAVTEGEVRSGTKTGKAQVTADVRVIDRAIVVTNPKLYGVDSGLPGGAILVTIDDVELEPLVEQAHETWPKELQAQFHVARQVMGLLSCPPKGKKVITYRLAGSATPQPKKKTVRCREPDIERISMGNIQDVPTYVQSRMLDEQTGYLHFNIWLLSLMPRIEKALDRLQKKGAKRLVLDLRGNPGGVGMMVVPLARLLLDEDTSLGKMRTRTMTQEFKVVQAEGRFDGPIIVLVDEMTGSTSEIFAASMQELGRLEVAGASPSQGAALPSLIEELPGGARLQYVVADYVSPKGASVEGKGVVPDIEVEESAAAYADGKDPVLQAAMQHFSN